MHTMKARADGFDGVDSYKPGDTLIVDTDQAKRLLLAGRGDLVGDNGAVLTVRAAAEALRLNADDVKKAAPAVRKALKSKK